MYYVFSWCIQGRSTDFWKSFLQPLYEYENHCWLIGLINLPLNIAYFFYLPYFYQIIRSFYHFQPSGRNRFQGDKRIFLFHRSSIVRPSPLTCRTIFKNHTFSTFSAVFGPTEFLVSKSWRKIGSSIFSSVNIIRHENITLPLPKMRFHIKESER